MSNTSSEPVLKFEGFEEDTLPRYTVVSPGKIQGISLNVGEQPKAIGVGISGYRFKIEPSNSLNTHNISGEELERMTQREN